MSRYTFPYGAFNIEPMPGQPQIALCHSFFVPAHLRGQGNGNRLKAAQNRLLIDNHYDLVICTVAHDNVRQRAVLKAAGWVMVTGFENSRLGGVTTVYQFNVSDARKYGCTCPSGDGSLNWPCPTHRAGADNQEVA